MQFHKLSCILYWISEEVALSMTWAAGNWAILAAFMTATIAVFAALVAARLLAHREAFSGRPDPEVFHAISPRRYEAMARLLSDEDHEFLKRQPGYRAEVGAKLKRERRRIFRMYVHELAGDFQRLHAAARLIALQAPEEHADLIPVLMRQQARFWKELAMLEIRMMVPGMRLDVSELIRAIQAVHAAAVLQSA